jgi:hypothetical protein
MKRFFCSSLLVLFMVLEVGCKTTAVNIKSDLGPFLVHWEQSIPKGHKAIWNVTFDRGDEPRFDHHLHIKTNSAIVIISRITDPGPAAAIRARNNPELMRITARYKIRNNGWANGRLKKKIVVPNQKWVVEIQSDNDSDPEWAATLEIKPL